MRFNVKGNLIISDPCYKRTTCSAIYNRRAKKGIWEGSITKSDEYIASLFAHHIDYSININDNRFKLISRNIAVDSGQCGIFSNEIYPYGDVGECGDINSFYGRVCDITLENEWGVIDNGGVVSRSGVGDSCYPAYGIYLNRHLIAVKLIYIYI